MQLLGEKGDSDLKAQAYIGLGNSKVRAEQIQHYQEALRLLGERGNVELRAQAYIGWRNAFRAKRQNKEAIEKYEQIFQLPNVSQNKKEKATQGIEQARRFLNPIKRYGNW